MDETQSNFFYEFDFGGAGKRAGEVNGSGDEREAGNSVAREEDVDEIAGVQFCVMRVCKKQQEISISVVLAKKQSRK